MGRPKVSCIVELMRAHGSIEYASSGANGLAGAALAEFEKEFGALDDSDDKRFLRELAVHTS